jgi:ATP-dependent DNA ligase
MPATGPGWCFFIFDLLHLDGDDVSVRPLIERKARLAALLSGVAPPLHYNDYHRGQGPAFHEQACKLSLEGIVSKRADAPPRSTRLNRLPANSNAPAVAAHSSTWWSSRC